MAELIDITPETGSERRRIVARKEPLAFVPTRKARSRGFYIARRKGWRADASWTIVMVIEESIDPDSPLEVHEPGRAKPDPLSKWVFRDRIIGIDELEKPLAA